MAWTPTYVLSRLSYTAYLVHFHILVLRVGIQRFPVYLSDYSVVSILVFNNRIKLREKNPLQWNNEHSDETSPMCSFGRSEYFRMGSFSSKLENIRPFCLLHLASNLEKRLYRRKKFLLFLRRSKKGRKMQQGKVYFISC